MVFNFVVCSKAAIVALDYKWVFLCKNRLKPCLKIYILLEMWDMRPIGPYYLLFLPCQVGNHACYWEKNINRTLSSNRLYVPLYQFDCHCPLITYPNAKLEYLRELEMSGVQHRLPECSPNLHSLNFRWRHYRQPYLHVWRRADERGAQRVHRGLRHPYYAYNKHGGIWSSGECTVIIIYIKTVSS